MNIWFGATAIIIGAWIVTALVYTFSGNKRLASRVLDFFSYSLTAAGFLGLFIALQNYEKRISLERKKTELADAGRQLFESISKKIIAICGKPGSVVILIDGCQSLPTYLQTLSGMDYSVPTIIPNISQNDNPLISRLKETPNEIRKHNDAVTEFRKQSSDIEAAIIQRDLITKTIMLFSLSFAVGHSRRGYDGWVDWQAGRRG